MILTLPFPSLSSRILSISFSLFFPATSLLISSFGDFSSIFVCPKTDNPLVTFAYPFLLTHTYSTRLKSQIKNPTQGSLVRFSSFVMFVFVLCQLVLTNYYYNILSWMICLPLFLRSFLDTKNLFCLCYGFFTWWLYPF